MVKMQSLDGEWTLCRLKTGEILPARVPGSVYSDLLRAEKMEDPFWRDNELQATRIMDEDFEYRRGFTADAELLGCRRVLLECKGLDTIAELRINGNLIGRAKNMHCTWEYDVKAFLNAGENEISVRFFSPTRYIKKAFAEDPMEGSSDAMEGFPLLRKAHCMFGWDWGPRLPDAGIWRGISVVGVNDARLEQVYVIQNHETEKVTLSFQIEKEALSPIATRVRVIVTAPDKTQWKSDGEPIEIGRPELWWPNGYGQQPLYTVEVQLLGPEGQMLDYWKRRIGLRTITVKNEKDEWGESFTQVVNGVEIFAMGADYIPEDNILSRVTPSRTRRLLEDCVAANYNTVRVWGGGYYPSDDFYDCCDELGLMVWQDCMFACADYSLTDEFEKSIRLEITQNMRRLRHHASLALWCGNNEMEWQQDKGDYHSNAKTRSDYIQMFEYIIRRLAKENDPQTFYWPSSPSSGGGFECPNDPNRGDVHYWDVWHQNKPFSDYRNYYFRYVSEFGFQSFPSLKTVESFTRPEDRNIFSRVMEMHQRNGQANGKILNYLSQTYLYPLNLDTLIYASQLLQAEAVKYGVEHWRRNRGRCMGTIYWQINDCWPVASWSSIDYFGRWKALHYFARRFFAPVMISCCEEGEMTQRPSCVSEYHDIEKSVRLCVSNETRREISGIVRWALRDASSGVLRSGEERVRVPALSSAWLNKLDFSQGNERRHYFSYKLEVAGEKVSEGSVLFCAPKHFMFQDPQLKCTVCGDEITVEAQAYARCVEIDSPDSDMILSDNYFDINGNAKTVKILRGKPNTLKVRSVYDIGR